LGVQLDPDRMAKYRELARQLQTAQQTSMVGDPRAEQHLPVLPKW
jgi:hypothetical protein